MTCPHPEVDRRVVATEAVGQVRHLSTRYPLSSGVTLTKAAWCAKCGALFLDGNWQSPRDRSEDL